jgi:hypothetical protein
MKNLFLGGATVLFLLALVLPACQKDNTLTTADQSISSMLSERGLMPHDSNGCHHPHDSLGWSGHHPHDTLGGGGHPHDSLGGGPHPHDSLWIGGGHPPFDSTHHPIDTSGHGGNGGGHGGPGGGHGGHGGGHGGGH